MAIQFLLVTFQEERAVLADGNRVGFTNHILMLPGDDYEISLDGDGYLPASQMVALGGTSMVKPKVVGFTSTSSVAGTPAVEVAAACEAVASGPALESLASAPVDAAPAPAAARAASPPELPVKPPAKRGAVRKGGSVRPRTAKAAAAAAKTSAPGGPARKAKQGG